MLSWRVIRAAGLTLLHCQQAKWQIERLECKCAEVSLRSTSAPVALLDLTAKDMLLRVYSFLDNCRLPLRPARRLCWVEGNPASSACGAVCPNLQDHAAHYGEWMLALPGCTFRRSS